MQSVEPRVEGKIERETVTGGNRIRAETECERDRDRHTPLQGRGGWEVQAEALATQGRSAGLLGSPWSWCIVSESYLLCGATGPRTPGSLYRGSGSGSVAGGRVLGRCWGMGKPPGLSQCCNFSVRQEKAEA